MVNKPKRRKRRVQKESEEDRLRQELTILHELANAIEAVLWIRDLKEERLLYVSPAFRRIFGRPVESLLQSPQTWLNSVHPEDRHRVLTAALQNARSSVDRMEYRIIRPDGSVRWIYDRSFPIRNPQGEVYRLAGIAEDITDQRH